jgi:RNA polymerase sigma factor (sigma-70 family)
MLTKDEQDKLVLSHLHLVTRALRTYRTHEDYQDMVQEGHIALIDCASKWSPGESSFYTFAWRRVVGSAVDYLRHTYGRNPEHRGKIVYLPNEDMEVFHGEGTSFTQVCAEMDFQAFLSNSTLAPIQRYIVEQLVYFGKQQKDLAEELGISSGAISQRMDTIRKKIGSKLDYA